tara:strand:- start:61 stop:1224 length:1164 start_codon:yes stop_codon:yes gene_type:complete
MRINITLLFIAFFSIINGQDYDQLLKEKENLIKEAKFLTSTLEQTQSSQQHTLESLRLINKEISVKEHLLELITQEFIILQSQETQIQKEIEKLITQLQILKKNYYNLIKITHKTIKGHNKLLFFLSASNFNQLLRRVYHFRQLEVNRRAKYIEIENLQKEVVANKKLIIAKKARQSDLTFAKNKELQLLKNSKISKQETIFILKNKEDSLVQEIKVKELEAGKITAEIIAILESKENKESTLTPELKLISSNFYGNKGRLPWPVSTGSIISKFGTIPHPILSGITIINNGVEISTNNKIVRSVFDGEVSKIIILPTGLKVVIIKHGEYLTVYSNLHTVNVEKGSKIKTKDNIGSLYADKNKNHQVLGFQIWKAREKLNPSHWISKH